MKSLYLIKPDLEERRIFIAIGLVCLITVDFLQLFIPRVIKWAIDDLTDYRIDIPSLRSVWIGAESCEFHHTKSASDTVLRRYGIHLALCLGFLFIPYNP